MKGNITPTEYDECVALAEYLDILQTQKKIRRYTHIPNETFTKVLSAKIKNKKQGVRPGFPDYVILCNATILFLEMKRTKGGIVSVEQKAWHDDFKAMGYRIVVCLGFEEAKKEIDAILKISI